LKKAEKETSKQKKTQNTKAAKEKKKKEQTNSQHYNLQHDFQYPKHYNHHIEKYSFTTNRG
jgi:hypothetical protein